MTSQDEKVSGRHIRRLVRLGAGLEKSLSAYAVAATAAGVSLLAMTTAAEAKIVYTPADTPIPKDGGPVPLDLNQDGTPDFFLSFWGVSASDGGVAALLAGPENQSNQILGRGSFGRGPSRAKSSYGHFFASALRAGAKVGPGKSYFQKATGLLALGRFGRSLSATYGQWWCTEPRYLGLKFSITGETHYGWAREQLKNGTPTVTGYAYETIANKPIVTGKTKDSDVIAQEDASLGCLAKGASAIPAWRAKPAPKAGQ